MLRPCITCQNNIWRGLSQVCIGVFFAPICTASCCRDAPIVESPHDPSSVPILSFFYILLETGVVHITPVVAVVAQVGESVLLTLVSGYAWYDKANSLLPIFHGPGACAVIFFDESVEEVYMLSQHLVGLVVCTPRRSESLLLPLPYPN